MLADRYQVVTLTEGQVVRGLTCLRVVIKHVVVDDAVEPRMSSVRRNCSSATMSWARRPAICMSSWIYGGYGALGAPVAASVVTVFSSLMWLPFNGAPKQLQLTRVVRYLSYFDGHRDRQELSGHASRPRHPGRTSIHRPECAAATAIFGIGARSPAAVRR